ncbi:hypothetical protein NA749_035300 [Streptomyces justiciae]|nr:hypothetical protein [Streptomyces justiciae]MCW8382112.1 hypothetical protein [Streptomyces justiciae]
MAEKRRTPWSSPAGARGRFDRRPEGRGIGGTLLNRIAAAHPTIRNGWPDRGYREAPVDHAARLGIDLEIARREPGARGFTVQPRRWAVDRLARESTPTRRGR